MTEPIVAVRGESVREVDPEIATCAVTVSARDRDRLETLRRLASRVDTVRAVLDGYPDAIEKRETSGMAVYPETRPSSERVRGYRGTVTTTITVTDFTVLGELLFRLADQDQTSVSGPWWGLRPGSPRYGEARRAAIDDAIGRAREYAEALGARVTGLVEVADSGLSTVASPRAMALGFGAAAEAGVPHLDLDPQRQTVSMSVEARFRISEPTVLSD